MESSLIVVTGASSGVGFELAKSLAENGHRVVTMSRSIGKLSNVIEHIDKLYYFPADIRHWDNVQEVFAEIVKEHGRVDCLVNNAAQFSLGKFIDQEIESIDSLIDTNIKGTIYCTRAVLSEMLRVQSGRIINILSVSGLHGIEDQAIYSSSKFAISGFMDSLAQEIKEHGIYITNLYPGGINTELWNKIDDSYSLDVTKFMSPRDITQVVEFLLDLPSNIVLKEMTFFPPNDWH